MLLATAPPEAPRKLVVGTKLAEPFAIRQPDGSWQGISIELWRDVAQALDLEFELVERDLDGLFAGLQEGSLDLAVAALTVTSEREAICDFTHPFFNTGLGIAVRSGGDGWLDLVAALVAPRFLAAVGALALVLFVAGALVWLFERRGNPEQFPADAVKGLGSAFWWSAVTMTTVGYGDLAPRTRGGRAVALVWMFTSVVIISSFTASLSSALTFERLRANVQGPEDLARVRVGTLASSTSQAYLDTRDVAYRSYPALEEALAALVADEVDALVYDAPMLQYVVTETRPRGVSVLPRIFNRQNYAIALRQGSPLREAVNREMLQLVSRDAFRRTLDRYLGS